MVSTGSIASDMYAKENGYGHLLFCIRCNRPKVP